MKQSISCKYRLPSHPSTLGFHMPIGYEARRTNRTSVTVIAPGVLEKNNYIVLKWGYQSAMPDFISTHSPSSSFPTPKTIWKYKNNHNGDQCDCGTSRLLRDGPNLYKPHQPFWRDSPQNVAQRMGLTEAQKRNVRSSLYLHGTNTWSE